MLYITTLLAIRYISSIYIRICQHRCVVFGSSRNAPSRQACRDGYWRFYRRGIMRRPPHITCRRGHNFSNMTVAEICSVRAAVFAAPTATATGISRRARHHACCGRASQQHDIPPAMWRMIQATGQTCICPVADTGASIVTVSRVAAPQPPAHTRKPRPCERGVWRHQT